MSANAWLHVILRFPILVALVIQRLHQNLRNPPRSARIMIVGVLFSLLGGFAGLIVAVFIRNAIACALTGTLAGAIMGVMMEAYPS